VLNDRVAYRNGLCHDNGLDVSEKVVVLGTLWFRVRGLPVMDDFPVDARLGGVARAWDSDVVCYKT
jgi:hypothetical protein